MDPLSIAASLAGLIALGGKVLSISYSVATKSQKQLTFLTRDVTSVRSVLLQIEGLFHSVSDVPSEKEWLTALQNTLADCGETFLALEKVLGDLVAKGKREKIWAKVKWTVKESEIMELAQRVESYKATLDLLLGVKTSKATSNMEKILEEVKERLGEVRKKEIPPLLRPPISWRQKLAKMEFAGGEDEPSDAQPSTTVLPVGTGKLDWLVSCEKTKQWDQPGVYGVCKDEGLPINLEDSSHISVAKFKLGDHQIHLVCQFEQNKMQPSLGLQFIRAWCIVSSKDDIFYLFVFLYDGMSNRFAITLDNQSLLWGTSPSGLSRVKRANECSPEEAPEYPIRVEGCAFASANMRNESILMTFESRDDRDLFLHRLYGLRYAMRGGQWLPVVHDIHPRLQNSSIKAKPQMVQIGYQEGTEKSYLQPVIYCNEDSRLRPLRMHVALSVFRHDLVIEGLDMSTYQVSRAELEIIVFTAKDPEAKIQTVSVTFSRLADAVRFYFCTLDLLAQYAYLAPIFTPRNKLGTWLFEKVGVNYDLDVGGERREVSLSNATASVWTDYFWRHFYIEVTPADPASAEVKRVVGIFNLKGAVYDYLRKENLHFQGWVRLVEGDDDGTLGENKMYKTSFLNLVGNEEAGDAIIQSIKGPNTKSEDSLKGLLKPDTLIEA